MCIRRKYGAENDVVARPDCAERGQEMGGCEDDGVGCSDRYEGLGWNGHCRGRSDGFAGGRGAFGVDLGADVVVAGCCVVVAADLVGRFGGETNGEGGLRETFI